MQLGLGCLGILVPQLANIQAVDYFLIVKVDVNPDQSALFTIAQEDPETTAQRLLIQQAIEFTDLSNSLKFWAINESPEGYSPDCRTVVLLPEEY